MTAAFPEKLESQKQNEEEVIRQEAQKNITKKELLRSVLSFAIGESGEYHIPSENVVYAKITSGIAPYSKYLAIQSDITSDLDITSANIHLAFHKEEYGVTFDDATEKHVYRVRIVADFEKMHTESLEQFARASVFSNTSIKPAEISDMVMKTSLSKERKNTILQIIHGLVEGTIERTDTGLQIHIREE